MRGSGKVHPPRNRRRRGRDQSSSQAPSARERAPARRLQLPAAPPPPLPEAPPAGGGGGPGSVRFSGPWGRGRRRSRPRGRPARRRRYLRVVGGGGCGPNQPLRDAVELVVHGGARRARSPRPTGCDAPRGRTPGPIFFFFFFSRRLNVQGPSGSRSTPRAPAGGERESPERSAVKKKKNQAKHTSRY